MVRYSEIIMENKEDLKINSIKALKIMLSYGEVKLPQNGTLIIDIKEEEYSINFPPNFIVNGDMTIAQGNHVNLSGDLTVTGSLSIFYTHTDTLPNKLKVGGHLDVSYTNIRALPENTYVGYDFEAIYTPLDIPITIDIPQSVKILGHITT